MWRSAESAGSGGAAVVRDEPWSRHTDFTRAGKAQPMADGRIRYERDGEGRALLGDPRTALTWLANEFSRLDIGFKAGDWASCGTCMVPLQVEPGYGVLGDIEVAVSG